MNLKLNTRKASPTTQNNGFSLLEVMIGMTVFALAAAGIGKGVLFARVQAELNVHAISVNTVVQGYLEQMKSLTMEQLTRDKIPTVRLLSEDGKIVEGKDELEEGVYTQVIPIDINNTQNNSGDDIRLEIQAIINDFRSDSDLPRIDITMNYRWERVGKRTDNRDKWAKGSFRYIRSRVRNI